ncbi:NAD(P)-binding protein [Xylariomycetidae sp. FL2044]|nr:NAD(P)-binding protein [Xylariomycetidae sp. FL2044]
MPPKVFIVTGASKGLGLAVAQSLVGASHKVFLVARSENEMQALKDQHPSSVDYMAADLGDLKVAPKITESTVKAFGKIDGIILNHGVLTPLSRIADSDAEEWRRAYDINFFSAVALLKEAVPELRKSSGRVIFVSSGAAFGAYAAWGSYGTSKAASNHLCTHLAIEEPAITAVAISPGRVDTAMQKVIRDGAQTGMSPEVHAMFVSDHEEGRLLKPEIPGQVIANLAENAPKDLSGKHYKWNATELASFQGS